MRRPWRTTTGKPLPDIGSHSSTFWRFPWTGATSSGQPGAAGSRRAIARSGHGRELAARERVRHGCLCAGTADRGGAGRAGAAAPAPEVGADTVTGRSRNLPAGGPARATRS